MKVLGWFGQRGMLWMGPGVHITFLGKTRSFHLYSYIIVRIIPTILIPSTSLWASSTTIAVRVFQQYIHNVLRAFYLLHFRHYYCTAVTTVVGVLTWTHRYNAVRGHRTGSNNLYSSSSVQYARNIMRLFLDETHALGAQIRYVTRTYVWLFGEESACATGRWTFGCSDTVMVNIWRIVYRGSAYILMGLWIDTNDHMYIENLAFDEKQCPPFFDVFGGSVPLFVIRPIYLFRRGYMLKIRNYPCLTMFKSMYLVCKIVSGICIPLDIYTRTRCTYFIENTFIGGGADLFIRLINVLSYE